MDRDHIDMNYRRQREMESLEEKGFYRGTPNDQQVMGQAELS